MAAIGFIGLGNMGLPMARNLLQAGHHLTAFDVMAAAVEARPRRRVHGRPPRRPRRPPMPRW